MSIRALLSRADGSDEAVELGDWTPRRIRDDELLWVDVEGGEALEDLGRALNLDGTLASLLRQQVTRPVAHVHDGAIEAVVVTLPDEPDDDPVPLRIVAGNGWVITHHSGPIAFLDEHRERIQDQREVGRLAPVEFLASVIDWHIDQFFQVAESLDREVDRLDHAALRSDRDLLDRLVVLRGRIARVRRLLIPHRQLAAELSRHEFLPEAHRDAAEALAAVAQRVDRAVEAIANARDMLIGTFDIHMTRMAQRTNDTMRVLTLASVVLLPSVVLAGIMGMNFRVGLFDEPNLFYVVVGAMIAMAVIALGVARSRGWL